MPQRICLSLPARDINIDAHKIWGWSIWMMTLIWYWFVICNWQCDVIRTVSIKGFQDGWNKALITKSFFFPEFLDFSAETALYKQFELLLAAMFRFIWEQLAFLWDLQHQWLLSSSVCNLVYLLSHKVYALFWQKLENNRCQFVKTISMCVVCSGFAEFSYLQVYPRLYRRTSWLFLFPINLFISFELSKNSQIFHQKFPEPKWHPILFLLWNQMSQLRWEYKWEKQQIITWWGFCGLQLVPSENWTSSRKVWQTWGWPL